MSKNQNMFPDGRERTFIPYKGWCINNMGQYIPDSLLNCDTGPLKIVTDSEKHPESGLFSTRHTTYNLFDNNDKKILPKCVRSITYNISQKYYVI